MPKTIAIIATLLVAPFVARAAASFYLTHKYEQFARHHLNSRVPVAQLGLSRGEVESALEPLKPQESRGALPAVFGAEEELQRGYAVKYYLLHPALTGCHLYFVFDGPAEGSRLIGYRDECE